MRENIVIINSLAILIHLWITGIGPPGFRNSSMIFADLICVFTLIFILFLIKDIGKGAKVNKDILFRTILNLVYVVYITIIM